MQGQEYVILLAQALSELYGAARALTAETQPATPLPRPRRFVLVPGWIWPGCDGYGTAGWFTLGLPNRDYQLLRQGAGDNAYVAKKLMQACGGQPRRVLRCLRRIQAATAWCQARAEGRRRAVQEILRQQARAADALEAEMTILALRGDEM